MTPADTPVASQVAIAGDGSGRRGPQAQDPSDVLAALKADVRMLGEMAGLPAVPVALTARDAAQLSAGLRALPVEVAAVFLAGTDPARARAAQRDLACTGGIPVATEQDTTAIALAAAVLTTLARAETTPQASQVVIAGADQLPLLTPLLIAAGIGDLVSWNQADAIGYPLATAAWRASAVVDLLGAASTLTPAFGEDVPVPVIALDDPVARLLAVPGLLRAIRHTAAAGVWADPLYHLDLHYACARALAALTPVDRLLPEMADPDLCEAVARAATDVLQHPPRTR